METGESRCLKWSFSLTLSEIPWRFSSILPNVKISLTLCKIPWQFPDLDKFYFSLTFPWRLWTLQSKLDLCSGNHVVYRQTDGQTDKVNPVYPPSNFVGRGYNDDQDVWHHMASPGHQHMWCWLHVSTTCIILTHQGWCIGNLTIIGSDNGLSPDRRQAIIWTNAGILLTGPLGTNSSEIKYSRKCIWKRHLANGTHFVSVSIC